MGLLKEFLYFKPMTFSPPESAVYEVTAFQIQKNDDTTDLIDARLRLFACVNKIFGIYFDFGKLTYCAVK